MRNNTYTQEGLARFERYFRNKGWFGFERLADGQDTVPVVADRGAGILLEVATAYGITKLLLAPRIAFSVWATPWFARSVIGPVAAVFRKAPR